MLVILPTGYGKSMIYNVLPTLLDIYHQTTEGHHIILVISPLVALMKEQVQRLKEKGITVVYLAETSFKGEQTPHSFWGQSSEYLVGWQAYFILENHTEDVTVRFTCIDSVLYCGLVSSKLL